MSRPYHRTLILAAGLLLASTLCPASTPAATPPATIQQRIDALLKHRLRPEPLPVDPPNPFLVINKGIRDSTADDAASKAAAVATNPLVDLAAASSAEVLLDCAGRLKIGGIIILNGQTQIVINGVRRKEGDVIATDWNYSIVQLRIVRILPGQIVLRLGEAETTRKY